MGLNPPGSLRSFPPPPDSLTYEPFYGLKEKAFSLSSDPRFLYDSPTHSASFDNLLAAIRRREGLIVLTGEIGIGKTMLCRAVLRSLGRKTFSSFVPDPFASRQDLLKMLLVDFGVVSIEDLTTGSLKGASRTELSYLLAGFLESLAPVDAFAVVIIDEAQNLLIPLIEETRILCDSFAGQGRLQIVFVGQLELHEKLKQPEMRQVDQRISSYTRLAPLDRDSVSGYIQHRLQVAGGSREHELFPPEVVDIIHRRSGGVPRLINRLCDRALQLAHRRQADSVDREILESALLEIGPATFTPTWASIEFPDRKGAESPEVAPTPAVRVLTPPLTSADPEPAFSTAPDPAPGTTPVEEVGSFATLIDQWETKDLPPPVRRAPRLQEFPSETSDTPASRARTTQRTVARRKERSAEADGYDELQFTYIQRLGRVWARRIAIAAISFVALNVLALGVFYVPGLFLESSGESSESVEAPTETAATPPAAARSEVPAVAVPTVATRSEEAAVPVPVATSEPVAEGEYLVAVGLYASRSYADRIVEELTGAGLSAMQRPFQFRGQMLEQVVLGPFDNRSDAVAELERLRELDGYDDAHVLDNTPQSSAR